MYKKEKSKILSKKANAEILLLIVIVFYLVFKIITVKPSVSDENVYLLMAKSLSEGKIPYRDFNFVHPPLQILIVGFLFKIFGTSFILAKVYTTILAIFSIILLYKISELIFKKKSIIPILFFVLFPSFIIFSDHMNGVWEALFFSMLSFYLFLKDKYLLSSIIYSLSIFYRYLSLFCFPYFLYFLIAKKRYKFLIYSIGSIIILFILFYLFFGFEFINQTILYQLTSIFFISSVPKDYSQFFNIEFFKISSFIIFVVFSFQKKEKLILFFSLYSILLELSIVLAFRTIIYHYFIFTLPFYALGSFFIILENKLIEKTFLLFFLFSSIIYNYPTFNFYVFGKSYEVMEKISKIVLSIVNKDDVIFGYSPIVDYISFTYNIKIANNYLDSYIDYLRFISEEKVIENLKIEKPKIIIDMSMYFSQNPKFYQYLQSNYDMIRIVEYRDVRFLIYKIKNKNEM